MFTSNHNVMQKQTYFRAYPELSKLESALRNLKKENASVIQISILVKVTQFFDDKDIEYSKDTAIINSYWEDLFGKTVNFGTFCNQECGSVFIVGSLITIFLHKINGKSLAALSSGTYGIFRGIGGSEEQSTINLKSLNSGSYLLILRGDKNILDLL